MFLVRIYLCRDFILVHLWKVPFFPLCIFTSEKQSKAVQPIFISLEWQTTRIQNPAEFPQSSSKISLKLTAREQKIWIELIILETIEVPNKRASRNFLVVWLIYFVFNLLICWAAVPVTIKHWFWDVDFQILKKKIWRFKFQCCKIEWGRQIFNSCLVTMTWRYVNGTVPVFLSRSLSSILGLLKHARISKVDLAFRYI